MDRDLTTTQDFTSERDYRGYHNLSDSEEAPQFPTPAHTPAVESRSTYRHVTFHRPTYRTTSLLDSISRTSPDALDRPPWMPQLVPPAPLLGATGATSEPHRSFVGAMYDSCSVGAPPEPLRDDSRRRQPSSFEHDVEQVRRSATPDVRARKKI